MHEVLVYRLGGLSLPRESVVRLTGRPDTTLDVYHGRKTAQHYNIGGRDNAGGVGGRGKLVAGLKHTEEPQASPLRCEV